jgi:hypothetical protein
MDDQVNQPFKELINQTLNGPGFIISSPKEREQYRQKLENYFFELIFDILMQHLSDAQIAELEAIPDLQSQGSQAKITQMAAAVPGFPVILKGRLEKEGEEIGRSGIIPDSLEEESY